MLKERKILKASVLPFEIDVLEFSHIIPINLRYRVDFEGFFSLITKYELLRYIQDLELSQPWILLIHILHFSIDSVILNKMIL